MVPDNDHIAFFPEPLNDDQLDELENAANALLEAVRADDFDAAYIIASTCRNPAMLAMFVAEMTGGDDDADSR